MTKKKIAGTIMLNCNNGDKKFLVHPVDEMTEFVTTNISPEMTGLASILQFFKTEVKIDITAISLVELTNAHKDIENMPLFVFEMSEKNIYPEKPMNKDYIWEEPLQVKSLLTSYDIQGVPMF